MVLPRARSLRSRRLPRPQIGWCADMVVVRPRRIDHDFSGQAGILDVMTEHRLCRGRTADVAHANKDDAYFIFIFHNINTANAE